MSHRSKRVSVKSPRSVAVIGGVCALLTVSTDLEAQAESCPDTAPGSASVAGLVRASESFVPLPGASVVARWPGETRETESGPDGSYLLCDLEPGDAVILRAAVPPYEGPGVPVTLAAGARSEVLLSVDFGGSARALFVGRIVGRVIDRETLEAVPNALLGAGNRGYTEISDAEGRFVLEEVSPGQVAVRVRHLAYGETETSLFVPSDGTLEVEIQLAAAVLPVEPIEVTVVGVRSRKLEVSGFYERRDWNERLGLGQYVTREDIEARSPARVSHLLTEIPRVDLIYGLCPGNRCNIPVIRGSGLSCERLKKSGGELTIGPSLYLDGHRLRWAIGSISNFSIIGVDELAMPSDVAGIEVYTGIGDLPGEFADPNAIQCGAIVIWTGR